MRPSRQPNDTYTLPRITSLQHCGHGIRTSTFVSKLRVWPKPRIGFGTPIPNEGEKKLPSTQESDGLSLVLHLVSEPDEM